MGLASPDDRTSFPDDAFLKAGQSERLIGTSEGWQAAARSFGRALELDAASASRWADFGDALEQSHDRAKAEYCFLRGVALAPNSPQILLDIADFYFLTGQHRKALPYSKKILALITEYDERIFNYYRLTGLDPGEILQSGIPNTRAEHAYFRSLNAAGDLKGSDAAWKWMAAHSRLDLGFGGEYSRLLARGHQYEQAARVWAAVAGGCDKQYLKTTQIYNGDFECALTGQLLDWQIYDFDGAQAAIDRDVHHSGAASLRLTFDGKHNVDYRHSTQEVFVTPGEYVLEAWIRCEKLTTDQGISLRVSGLPQPPAIETEKGTTDWTKVTQTFTAPKEPAMLLVQIARQPSFRFDNQISGVAWIDSVAIRRIERK